jgi:prolyl oligopeptidase
MQVMQHHAVSADGERIPYFVVAPRGFEANGTNPTLMFAYGGFEVPYPPHYSGLVGSAWLARGGVYVVANIRGGGEFGPRWHQAALRENRQRAFDDLIAVAEDLVERKITSPRHLGIRGGSNGGLLVGAVMVQRPDLFNAVISQVPLLDMRRYHLLLAGASWMAEYGNPDEPADWAYISRYSPYQNLSAEAEYPVAFFTTSTRDDRVHPGHARKMVAKMLDQGHEVLYYENIEGGHGGAANLQQSAYINALMYSYLLEQLGPAPGEE